MIICTFDDRASDIVGLKLLIDSLNKFAPGVALYLACPVADQDFEQWLKDYPQVVFDRAERWLGKGWDVKPLLLTELLQRGHEQVMWMDSDIIVTGDFLGSLPADDALVVTEEPGLSDFGVSQRAQGWGLTQARRIPAVNSCVVRVSQCHQPLLDAWLELLRHPDYQRARSEPFEKRMPHVLGDQDVLVALLASKPFDTLRLHYLRAGREIIQLHGPQGYPALHRLRHLVSGMPPLVHSQGHKPWRPPADSFLRLHLEIAPYAHFARLHRAVIRPFPAPMEIHSAAGRLSRVMSFGHPALGGLSLSVVAGLASHWRRASGLGGRAVGKARSVLFRTKSRH